MQRPWIRQSAHGACRIFLHQHNRLPFVRRDGRDAVIWHATLRVGLLIAAGLYWATIRALEASAAAAGVVTVGILVVMEIAR